MTPHKELCAPGRCADFLRCRETIADLRKANKELRFRLDAELAGMTDATIADLRARLAEEEKYHRAFTQLVADMHGDFECDPACDSYGHTETCAATDPVVAFRALRVRLEAAEKAADKIPDLRTQLDEALAAKEEAQRQVYELDRVVEAANERGDDATLRADRNADAALAAEQRVKELEAEIAKLREALRPFAEAGVELTGANCHAGITTAEQCVRCSKVLAARVALGDAP